MTRIPTYGISMIILLAFSACQPIAALQKQSRLLKEYNHYYLNDSLHFSYKIPADYQAFLTKKEIKKALSSQVVSLEKAKLPIKLKHCLGYFKTKEAPELEHWLLYFRSIKEADIHLSNIIRIPIINLGGLSNGRPHVDPVQRIVLKVMLAGEQGEDGVICIVGQSNKMHFRNLKNEYLDFVFMHYKQGENYDKLAFKDPFSLARKVSFCPDSAMNYVRPLELLESREANYFTRSTQATYVQALATYQSFISNNQPAFQSSISKWRSMSYLGEKDKIDVAFSHYDDDAIDYLIKASENQQVVMLNENHFSPENRLLAQRLLKAWHAQGFRFLAMESVWENKDSLNQRGYPVRQTGFYTREPVMGALIRDAIDMGFTVFGYDFFSEKREESQARNIYNETLKQDPESKVIVLAGFGHIGERTGGRKEMMAAKFKALSGIDPLTIDQVQYRNPGKHWLGIVDTAGTNDRHKLKADIYLANAMSPEHGGSSPSMALYSINLPDSIWQTTSLVKTKYAGLAQVFDAEEYAENSQAIPFANVIILAENPQNLIEVSLSPKREYICIIRNFWGKEIHSTPLNKH